MSTNKLERAREHCFMGGVGDSGMNLCAANVPYGIAKIHHVQASMGLPPDATFVASPDATITRNDLRWQQGFGYGGVYTWTGDFHVLDIKANACGMMVGALPAYPELEDVRERLHTFEAEGLTLEGVEVDNDLTEPNHFVDVFSVDPSSAEPPPGGASHYFIMHSSGHEHRGPTPRGVGLYWDLSEQLMSMATIHDTPWGNLRVLEGDAAREWYEFYQKVQAFNHRRREALARHLFGDLTSVINATHQGLVRGFNRANVGCYTFEDDAAGDDRLFPLTLSAELPSFIVRGENNFTEATIEAQGWSDRVERHGLWDRIRGTNLLPHGGGYTYSHFSGVRQVIEEGPDARVFELEPTAPGGEPERIRTPKKLPYAYRGMEVKDCMEELGLGRAIVTLDLKYVLKS